ncbi:prenyltransferase [Halovenus sp. WSH3]|uniref:Prenyltransferase n=1 Tax=Halovenus carboxidivorans TaxID=2692199 RepID=A0A6B0T7B4_9EURY|nr:UbiA family prenyltransferase [Halovenus carboxidivorans]MXR50780.1 prenyltransferase [Halovenus carboxidivorans]
MSSETASRPGTLAKTALLTLVHSNLLISLSATSVAVSTIVLADLRLEPIPLFIVFAVTLFVYSFNRLTDRAEDERNVPGRASFVERYGRVLLAAGILLYAAATVTAIVTGIPGAPAMIVPLAVAVLYSVFGVKRILLVKNLLVGLSWGMIPLGVGVYYEALFTVDILFLFAFVTTALTIAAVVFDIKDIEGDREEGIRTVPLVVGVARTRHLAAAASALLGVVVVSAVAVGLVHPQYLLLVGYTTYMTGYSLTARVDRTPLFYGLVIDSEQILLAAGVLCTELLLS